MPIIDSRCIALQTVPLEKPSVPSWFAELILLTQTLKQHEVFKQIEQQVHVVRRRFGQYEVIDYFALLFGYALSGERTLQAFFERLTPFAPAFMALFGRHHLPHRSSLSRFLAAVDT